MASVECLLDWTEPVCWLAYRVMGVCLWATPCRRDALGRLEPQHSACLGEKRGKGISGKGHRTRGRA